MDDIRHYHHLQPDHRFCFSERSGRCQGCLGEIVSFQGGNRMRLRPWAGSLYWACEDSETEHRFIANFNVMRGHRMEAWRLGGAWADNQLVSAGSRRGAGIGDLGAIGRSAAVPAAGCVGVCVGVERVA